MVIYMIDVKTANVLFLDGEYKRAVQMYLDGAREGDAECAFNYAYCLYRGIGVMTDLKAAKSFFAFARERVPEASYNLAVMYMHGAGVARNYRTAIEYMEDAARAGVIEAELYMGVAHTIGTVFEPDVVLISKIPYHTAEYDSTPLIEGDVRDTEADEEDRIRAVRLDHKSAFEWFRVAAKHPSDYVEDMARKSKYLYARCFIDGLGTDFNRDRGNALMLLAAKDGSEEAAYYLTTEAPYVLDKLDDTDFLENIRKIERLG